MPSVGKRLSTNEPLTTHDIAERLDKAMYRVLRILMDARQMGMMPDVKTSRYHSNVIDLLLKELQLWKDDEPMTQTSDAMRTRAVANLEGTVWALREGGMPLTEVAEIVERANKSWDPSEDPAFVVVDEDARKRNEPAIMRRMDGLRDAINQGDLNAIKFAFDQVLRGLTKMFEPR